MRMYVVRYALKRYGQYREVGPISAAEVGAAVLAWKQKAYDVYAVEA